MANVAPSTDHASLWGVSLNVSGTAIASNLTGDWVTPLSDVEIDSIAIHYAQAAGTATTVTIAIDVMIAADTVIYVLNGTGAAGAPTAYSLVVPDADTDVFVTLATLGAAGAPIPTSLGGISAIRARASIGAGAGSGADNLRITFTGKRSVSL